MAEFQDIIGKVDEEIASEFDSDQTFGDQCVRTSNMLAKATPYSPSQIGAALGKHPEMSEYDIGSPSVGVWRFRK